MNSMHKGLYMIHTVRWLIRGFVPLVFIADFLSFQKKGYCSGLFAGNLAIQMQVQPL